ncbi:MAG: RDD family protein [Candidatus Nitronauta litoralis]|uniref:RDD family protein n=1 Tax=Candidatus Nitronauta litoralis TaxID=2705533 RepID=A0A7T0BXV4_9BACT|nr:MAG: RDD family protein [Candidatus Nitronauta litoralis]
MQEENYAGFWIRAVAVLIDVVIMIVVLGIPLAFIFGGPLEPGSGADVLFNYIVPFALTVFFWLKYLGTPGKMILKLKVVDKDTHQALSMGQAVGRYFAYIIAILPLFLGFIWIAFDENKQGWHDKLAGSVVLRDE